MSWIFGYSKPSVPPSPQQYDPAGSSRSQALSEEQKVYGFGSAALERAAAAARELEVSRHSKDALELSRLQEITRQQEQATKAKEYEAVIETAKVEQKRIDYEEKRKTMREETKQHQERAQFQDQLARKRHNDQLVSAARAQEESLRRQEVSVVRQEDLRRATAERERELWEQTKLKAIEAKEAARARAERNNRDLVLERIKVEAGERRTTMLEGIHAAGETAGAGIRNLLSDRTRLVTAVGGLSLLALGVYSARAATSVTARIVEAHLGRPTLVKETSRFSLLETIKHPVRTLTVAVSNRRRDDALSGVVLNPPLEKKLRDIAIATKNTCKNKGYYRNMLVYGPPGTGKTLFARRLALHSGLDYAVLTGGDIVPLGSRAAAELHTVFDWAEASRRGAVLFVDEADAFLRKRSNENIGENLRAAFNAFLYRTSSPSNRVMLILASNTPQQFDSAVSDRVDTVIEFPLPGSAERERLLRLYLDKFVLEPATRRRFVVEQFDYGALCAFLATRTGGLSGRALAQLATAWVAAAHSHTDGRLTRQMCIDICDDAVQSHKQKVTWLSDEEKAPSMFPYLLDMPKTTYNINQNTTVVDSNKTVQQVIN